MPISRGSHISAVIEEVKHLNPQSILDVGCGFGLMGAIFRAYTDIRLSELNPERYSKWQTRIDGIEVFVGYRNPLWTAYTGIILNDARIALDECAEYDLIYAGDIIEHFTKENGHELIRKMLKKGKKVIIATPSPAPKQDPLLGNAHEEHLSSWDETDFVNYQHEIIGSFGGILVVRLWEN